MSHPEFSAEGLIEANKDSKEAGAALAGRAVRSAAALAIACRAHKWGQWAQSRRQL